MKLLNGLYLNFFSISLLRYLKLNSNRSTRLKTVEFVKHSKN